MGGGTSKNKYGAGGEEGGGGGGGGKMTKMHSEEKDCNWHMKHCLESDLAPVHTIAEAYPGKPGGIRSKSSNGHDMLETTKVDKNSKFSNVKVECFGPPKIFCDACGVFIASRMDDVLFYVCKGCRKAGRKLELCEKCHAAGALKVQHTTRYTVGMNSASKPASWPRQTSIGSEDVRGAKRDSKERSGSKDRQSTRSKGSQDDERVVVPSGDWKLEIEENGSKRKEEREWIFQENGRINGSGDDCTVTGTYTTDRIMVRDAFGWGHVDMEGVITLKKNTHKVLRITGAFKASDGGKGIFTATPPAGS